MDQPEKQKKGIKLSHWHYNWIITVVIGLALCLILYKVYNIQTNQKDQLQKQIETNQFLTSSINTEALHQRYILFMRDKIVNRWKERGVKNPDYERAYRQSEILYREFTKYPFLPDPFFQLAIQRIESNFGVDSISPAGAYGLNQLMPLTAKLICPMLGLTYSDRLLFDIDASTRIAAKYMEEVYSTYPDMELLLAGYNGSDKQIYYYKKKCNSLSDETKGYVPMVMTAWREYQKEFKAYKTDSLLVH